MAAVRARQPRVPPGYHGHHVARPAIRPRHYCASPSSPTTLTRLGSRWYHDPRKVAASVSVVAAAICYQSLEVIPWTNRAHFIFLSPQSERAHGLAEFADYKQEVASKILGPRHPHSVRARRIAERIIHAGIDDTVILHVASNRHKGKAWLPPPQTRHLHGLDWEVIVVDHKGNTGAYCTRGGKIVLYTGLLDHFKTDGEIAFVIAHEVAHIIARHESEISSTKWVTKPLYYYFRRRTETEADHIGILLLAAAGFDPHMALTFFNKNARLVQFQTFKEYYLSSHPPYQRRLQFLSQRKIMKTALELYREATSIKDSIKR
ncbi:hypothetical protein VPH35_094090 [Triticum aestivum]|uniref:mitochondrial metalloendopeptidase OMA1 n=1 Tax=Triticum aestivum TaxID=4565 RepID=UPI001D0200BE|nr:mitochondrial metalloendopeptidase OMA1-like [Triticum aestivum]